MGANGRAGALPLGISDEEDGGSEVDDASHTDGSQVSSIDEDGSDEEAAERCARSSRLAQALRSNDEEAVKPLQGMFQGGGGADSRLGPNSWNGNRFLPRGSAQFQDQHWYRALHIEEIVRGEDLSALASASLPSDKREEKALDAVQMACTEYLTGLRDWAQPLLFSACQALTPEDSRDIRQARTSRWRCRKKRLKSMR